MIYWGEYFEVTKAMLTRVATDLRFRATRKEDVDGKMQELAEELASKKPN